ncbi:hypothetical protein, partial [Marivita lacus]|uniref:hypothetical protein n=1 Tax=Marivita lacus TaxID=1323742 RepID=UPI001666348F
MRIKIIDLPTYETDPDIIAEHLQKVLKEIRKKKLARDLIGEDERSSEFEVDDFDDFADKLSDGTDLTMVSIRWRPRSSDLDQGRGPVPFPRQQLVQARDRHIGDAGDDV